MKITGKPEELVTWLMALIRAGDDKTYTLSEHMEKRSLSQNGYYWLLLGKVARLLKMSNTELHNQMLADYGFRDLEMHDIIMRDDIDWRKLDRLHVRPTAQIRVLGNGKLYRVYYVMRGSSTYDTKEMSRLLDGMIQEAQAQGIETITPAELERMRREEAEAEARRERRRAS